MLADGRTLGQEGRRKKEEEYLHFKPAGLP
jgi:hypothetical protein